MARLASAAQAALLASLASLLPAPVRAADAPLAVRCGALLDPATRSVARNVVVAVQGGLVAKEAPAGAQVLDLTAFTCLPGLVDAHTHLLLQGDALAEDYDEQVLKESSPYRALRAAAAARIALSHGFTTLRDLGTEGAGYVDVDLARAFERGILEGPRVVTSGPAMSVTGGYPLLGYSWERRMPDGVLKCDGADACRRAVREQVQHGVDWIKVYADRSYSRTPEGAWAAIANFTPEEMGAIVDEAHRLRKRVAAHSMTPSGHRVALNAGVDSIEHGDALDDESLRIMAARRVPYCPTITALDTVRGPRGKTNPIWNQLWDACRESFRRAMKAGVPIAFGTDAGAFRWEDRSQADEARLMVDFGMPAWDVLRSATTVSAELLKEPRLGCLNAGCFADLVAVESDPSKDIEALRRVRFVMKAGKVFVRP